jgi:hypothetical protein
MNNNHGAIATGILVIGLLLSSCAPGQSLEPALLPTSTPTPFAKEGHWEGDPSVSFVVTADGKVSNFSILIGGECDVKVNASIPISANHILLIGEVDADGQPTNNGILGTFDSPTTITGSFASPWKCGTASAYTALYLPSALTTWSAEWKSP